MSLIWKMGYGPAVMANQSHEIERLKAENAKLQERVEWLDGECRKSIGMSHKFFEMIGEYQKENAKLRELVLEIWRSCPVSENDCAKCPHRIEESDEDWCDIPILMSELGIEVE